MMTRLRRRSPWPWINDALDEIPGLECRRMFGCTTRYRDRKILLVLTGENEEPWNGVCACVEWEHHETVKTLLPALSEHPILGKWLYVSQLDSQFESTVTGILRMIAKSDPRIGVTPTPKKRKITRMEPLSKSKKSVDTPKHGAFVRPSSKISKGPHRP